MKKIKVLCVCAKGLNRSKYLASYLRRKGYSTRYGGVEKLDDDSNFKGIKGEDVDWAEIIIIVRKRLVDIFNNKFGKQNKRMIILDVTDSWNIIRQEHPELNEASTRELNKKVTYPNLRRAIKGYLPLKK